MAAPVAATKKSTSDAPDIHSLSTKMATHLRVGKNSCEQPNHTAKLVTNGSTAVPITFKIGESDDDSDSEDDQIQMADAKSPCGIPQDFPCAENTGITEGTEPEKPVRDLEECVRIYKADEGSGKRLTDDEVLALVDSKHILAYQLEKAVEDPNRGVGIR